MSIDQAREILGGHFGFIADDGQEVIDSLGLAPDANVLDVGTGTGYFAILLALNGCRVATGEPEADDSIHAKQDWLGNAQKAGVDALIDFRPFSADAMPFNDHAFDAVFYLGVLHHIDEAARAGALAESVRVARLNAPICFFEPNRSTLAMVKEHDQSHPEAADPSQYTQGLNLSLERRAGRYFDVFVFRCSA